MVCITVGPVQFVLAFLILHININSEGNAMRPLNDPSRNHDNNNHNNYA